MNRDELNMTCCVQMRSAGAVGAQMVVLAGPHSGSTPEDVEQMLWEWMIERDYYDLYNAMSARLRDRHGRD